MTTGSPSPDAAGVPPTAVAAIPLAPGIDLLVLCRVAQGVAGGLLVSAGITVLADVAGSDRMGRILAVTEAAQRQSPIAPEVLTPLLAGAVVLAVFARRSRR